MFSWYLMIALSVTYVHTVVLYSMMKHEKRCTAGVCFILFGGSTAHGEIFPFRSNSTARHSNLFGTHFARSVNAFRPRLTPFDDIDPALS